MVAAETVLSDVDGLAGRLIIRGHSLDELAGRATAEEVLALLLGDFFDELPAGPAAALGAARAEVFAAFAALAARLAQTCRSTTPSARWWPGCPTTTTSRPRLLLVAAPAVLVPALLRLQRGEAAGGARSRGSATPPTSCACSRPCPPRRRGAALDTYLVTVADHGLNASTFAARVVASTQAGLTSSVLAGIGALKGPLHGGAPGPVLDMLDAIGTAERAEPGSTACSTAASG